MRHYPFVETDYAANLSGVRERIARACDAAKRDPASVTLVAVSKFHPLDALRALYDLGQREFGESRVQEALPKIDAMPNDVTWHLIGRLQSNKAKRAAGAFDAIHTFETEAQLSEIEKSGRTIEGLVEVNLAQEGQKAGLSLDNVPAYVKKVVQCPCVRFRGLMAIGPAEFSDEDLRPLYKALAEENARLGGTWLSLGMSGDLEAAIAAGSTHVRVGTALFGSRMPS